MNEYEKKAYIIKELINYTVFPRLRHWSRIYKQALLKTPCLDSSQIHEFTEVPSLAKRDFEILIWVFLVRILILLWQAQKSEYSK